MKTNFYAIIVLAVSIVINSGSLFGQKSLKVKDFPENLPKIELEEKTPQKYLMIIDNQNFDIYGNFTGKSKVSGEYTRGLPNDSVRWNNVRIAGSKKLNEAFAEGVKQSSMENYSYVVWDEMAKKTFFKVTPETDIQMKTLVWDIFSFEVFAWNFWDLLQLNVQYSAREINSEIQIEGLGNIEGKDVHITWTGITKKNGKLCAIINYMAMNNPLNFYMHNTEIKGTTHFWGSVYVSLTDKQIEYGDLHEILFMDIVMNGQTSGNKAYSTRNITLEKIY